MPGIAATVAALKVGVEAVLPLDGLRHSGTLQLHEAVALRIDIGRDVVGYLSRRAAEAHPRIIGHGTKPAGATVL